jgi:hypothetical protein
VRARDEGRKDERTKKGTRLIAVLSFHDVARAALKAASFENRLLKQYIKNWPEPDPAD